MGDYAQIADPVEVPTVDKRLTLEKIIYAKSVPFTNKQLNDVLNLEIETHLRNNPDLVFAAVAKQPIKNADRSLTFTIYFHKPTA